jgi:hypothetical protein
MHYPSTPMVALMDCIHTWLNKWRMQGNFTKSKVMVFHPKEGDARSVLNTGH